MAPAAGIFGKSMKFGDPKGITIPEDRQRSGGEAMATDDLEPSIRARGIMNPLIVKKGPGGTIQLVAGERRLRTALKLGLDSVPYRFMDDLDPIELQIVELEENERRKDLEWRDHVRAIAKIHSLYELRASRAGEPWSIQRSADMLFYAQGHISKILRIERDLANPKIANAPGLNAAYNVLSKIDDRGVADAMNSLLDAGRQAAAPQKAVALPVAIAASPGGVPQIIPVQLPALPQQITHPESILQESFLDWAPAYAGPRFSFVHCDFPYGANLFDGPQSGKDKWEGQTYDDDPDVFWRLLKCFLLHRDNFMAPSAHVMFWFDMDYYPDILALCAELAPELMVRRKPLIWTKTDNAGILSDPKRGPRHIYESCLVMSREDRFIVKAKSDSYGCHTDKDWHPSTKPEAMLRYFMEMFVDEHTTMLDPTCGGGSALRAAESLGATKVIGLEINGEFFENAKTALRQFRNKASLSKKVAKQ